MAYVSLYRRYRPQTFDEVVGQEPVIRTLANAITEERLHHAYLFTGPRGTGKTSTARILAKAINCEQGPTPTPCNACRQCQEITDGSSVDVIELDMASHGGVDDARELRDRALFAPASARRKVYILDEVHMASTAAFNALLKLIEEPPEHVLFAMATTDPQKVLPTIMSRVQRLDLRRVSAADVAANVRMICQAEGYEIDDAAVEAIVRAGDGSLRDTQSVLEQVLAFTGTAVTVEAVNQVLGLTPAERVAAVVDHLADRDLAGLLAAVQQLVDDGHDLRRFTLDLVDHLRDLLVLGAAPDHPDLIDATTQRRELLQEQSSALPADTVLRAVRVLADTIAEQRVGSPRLPLELAFATLTVPSSSAQLDELTDRLARLEAGSFPASQPAAPRETHGTSVARGSAAIAAASLDQQATTTDPDLEPDAPQAEEAAIDEMPGNSEVDGTEATDVVGQVDTEAGPDDDATPDDGVTAGPAGPLTYDDPRTDDHAPAADVAGEARDVTGDAGAVGGEAEAVGGEAEAGARDAVDASDDAAEPADETGAVADDVAVEDDLARIVSRWDAILEIVREGSRRHHAVFAPATPVRAGDGILTLRYGRRYASFHAANAAGGEYAAAMQQAVEQTCGLRVRLDIIIEGEDERRRPRPPAVTPDDARTPVFPNEVEPSSAPQRTSDPMGGAASEDTSEELDVREAEASGPAQTDPEKVGRLLAEQLGAELLDERPPPE